MKTYGNLILMTVICIIIFWVFMALRPAHAADDDTFYLGTCIVKEVPEARTTASSLKRTTTLRKLAIEQKVDGQPMQAQQGSRQGRVE